MGRVQTARSRRATGLKAESLHVVFPLLSLEGLGESL